MPEFPDRSSPIQYQVSPTRISPAPCASIRLPLVSFQKPPFLNVTITSAPAPAEPVTPAAPEVPALPARPPVPAAPAPPVVPAMPVAVVPAAPLAPAAPAVPAAPAPPAPPAPAVPAPPAPAVAAVPPVPGCPWGPFLSAHPTTSAPHSTIAQGGSDAFGAIRGRGRASNMGQNSRRAIR